MEKVAIIQPCGNTPKSPTKIPSGPLCGDEPFVGGTLFETVLRGFEHKKASPFSGRLVPILIAYHNRCLVAPS